MNITNFFQPVIANSSKGVKTAAPKHAEGNTFHAFLNTDDAVEAKDGLLEGMDNKSLLSRLFKALDNGMSLDQFLQTLQTDDIANLLDQFPELKSEFSVLASLLELSELDKGSSIQLLDELKELFDGISADETMGSPIVPVSHIDLTELEDQSELLMQLINQLLTDISSLLHVFKEEGKLNNAEGSKLVALLKQWSMLKQQGNESGIDVSKLVDETLDEDSELWQELVSRFEKRAFYTGQNMYNQESSVSKQDVMNWLQQANAQYKNVTHTSAVQHGQAPISKVEQYVIHVQGMDKVEAVGTEVMEKFTNVIRESNFLTRNNGQMELSILLRPEHLGNITVRFTQVDGEMMVKLLVSSQMAKEMLENNIHQLRHLFSPHQVAIERNESISDEEFYFSEQEDNEQQEEQLTEENNKDQHHDHHQENNEVDFETIFNKLSEEGIV